MTRGELAAAIPGASADDGGVSFPCPGCGGLNDASASIDDAGQPRFSCPGGCAEAEIIAGVLGLQAFLARAGNGTGTKENPALEQSQGRKRAHGNLSDLIRQQIQADPQRAYELVLKQELQHKTGGAKDELYAWCPFHDDGNEPNWRVNLGKGVWRCDPCGEGGDLFNLVQRIQGGDFKSALKWLAELLSLDQYQNGGSQRSAPKSSTTSNKDKKLVRTIRYEVRDLGGELKATHLRHEYDDGSKSMPWEPGGVKTAELPLYGVNRLSECADGEAVIVCEGEKDAQSLIDRRENAVGTVTGAGVIPCDEALAALMRFAVYLWPDNDDAGQAHMRQVGERLLTLGHDAVWQVEWSAAPAKGGAADFTGDLAGLLGAALRVERQWAIACESAEAAIISNAVYLSRPAIVANLYYTHHISLGVGGKHEGKTTLVRTEALSIALGMAIYGRAVTQSPVVYAASDDEYPSTRMQLLRMGWNPGVPLTLVRIAPGSQGNADAVLEDIARLALRQRAYFVFLDMLFDFAGIVDELKYAHTREATSKIQQLADAIDGHVKATHHSPKWMPDAATAAKAALGSQGLVARFSPVLLSKQWAADLYTVESTMTRDPRGKAVPPSLVTLNEMGWAVAAEEFKSWMKWKVYAGRIKELFEAEPNRGRTAFSVVEALGIPRPEAQNALARMVEGAEPVLERKKGKGNSYVYRLKQGGFNGFGQDNQDWRQDS